MIHKAASFVLFVVLVVSAFFIVTTSPKEFVQERPAKVHEYVKMDGSATRVAYVVVASYEPGVAV